MATNDAEIVVDSEALGKVRQEEKQWSSRKETTRRLLAAAIVVVFGVSLILPLGIGLCISPDRAEYVTKVVIPLLDALARFSAGIFGPLLAFILGYYFSGN
ncbi:MAG TPA: hypothetical protein VGS57_11995 [Thermoanaerobaculia bacterium]|jgi:hypothetical protein|nr:hypothetical protein [Thermoanaerobaculia bacterium]